MTDALKTPLGQSLMRLAGARGQDATSQLGLNLPCKVAKVVSPWIVEVNLEVGSDGPLPQLTVPVLAPPYIAYPVQVGDAGLLLSASVRLGALSGLGGGTPNLYDTPGNLSALGFVWLGNASWTTIDKAAVVIWENIVASRTELAFYGGTKVAQPAITGALSAVTDANAKAVLTSIIAALKSGAGVNLAKDQTT